MVVTYFCASYFTWRNRSAWVNLVFLQDKSDCKLFVGCSRHWRALQHFCTFLNVDFIQIFLLFASHSNSCKMSLSWVIQTCNSIFFGTDILAALSWFCRPLWDNRDTWNVWGAKEDLRSNPARQGVESGLCSSALITLFLSDKLHPSHGGTKILFLLEKLHWILHFPSLKDRTFQVDFLRFYWNNCCGFALLIPLPNSQQEFLLLL